MTISQRGGAWDSRPVSNALVIPRSFNGPLESGQGGYCSGLVASFVGGPAEVSLRRPVPLDTPLDVVRESDGSVRVVDDREALLAEARSAPELDVEVPARVHPREARLAMTRYRGSSEGVFSRSSCGLCSIAPPISRCT